MFSDKDYKIPPMLVCPREWFDVEKAKELGLSNDALLYGLSYLRDVYPVQVADYTRAKDEFVSVYTRHGFESLLDFYRTISNDLAPFASAPNATSTFTCRGCEIRKPGSTILEQDFCYVFRFNPVERGLGVYSATRAIMLRFKAKSQNLVQSSLEWPLYFNPFPSVLFSVYPMLTVRPLYDNVIKFQEHKLVTMNSIESPCSQADPHRPNPSATCMAQCHNELYKRKLGCGLLWLYNGRRPLAEYCNTLNKVQLGNRTLDQFFASAENAEIDNAAADICVARCPRECDRQMIDAVSQMHYSLGEHATAEALQENVTLIKISVKHGGVFQGGVVEFHEVSTYTLTQLVTNIGGTLGLFVGATMLTFAQLFMFVLEFLMKCRNEKK